MKGRQAAERRKKGWWVSQEKFNKTISYGGRGPRQNAGEGLQLISVLDPTPLPVL